MDLFEKISGPFNVKQGFEKAILFPDMLKKVTSIKPQLASDLNLPD